VTMTATPVRTLNDGTSIPQLGFASRIDAADTVEDLDKGEEGRTGA